MSELKLKLLWTPAKFTQLKALVAQHLSSIQIAGIMQEFSPEQIRRKCGKHAIKIVRNKYTPKRADFTLRVKPENKIPPSSIDLRHYPDEPAPLGPVGQLWSNGCEWIFGDIQKGEAQFCGNPGKPYCLFHADKCGAAYTPPVRMRA